MPQSEDTRLVVGAGVIFRAKIAFSKRKVSNLFDKKYKNAQVSGKAVAVKAICIKNRHLGVLHVNWDTQRGSEARKEH